MADCRLHDDALHPTVALHPMGTSPLSVPRVHGHVATSLPALVSRGAVALFALGFILFQKKLLPRPLARAAARVYFWPTIPFTMAMQNSSM